MHELWPVLTSKIMIVLSIHDEKDGKATFQCSTRYDWYMLENTDRENADTTDEPTTVRDETGEVHLVHLSSFPFLPNAHFDMFVELFDFEQKHTFTDVLFSRSAYGTDKKHVSKTKRDDFQFPCIHSMNRKGITLVYSNTDTNGHFGVPKVVLSFGRYQYPYNDAKGDYGMTQIAFGLPIESELEGEMIIAGIQHPKFVAFLNASKWCTFYTDWRIFLWLKRDFYNYM